MSGTRTRRWRQAARRGVGGTLAAVALLASLAGPALAARPNNQACLGHDISGYAAGGAEFGGFVAWMATSTPGVGTQIQAHLAGEIPENECYDG